MGAVAPATEDQMSTTEYRNVETVTDEDGEEHEVCGTCYCDPCCCQQVIDQGAGDD